jgi:NhaP-type Na+/H+ or K+/H+ antiporter
MSELNVALVAVGGLTLVLSLAAGFVRNRVFCLSEPMAAVALGVIVGPAGLGLLHLARWGDPFAIVEQAARLTVGLAVMAAALRLPRRYVQGNRRPMAAVLLLGMGGMWLVSTLLVALVLGVSLPLAALVGAVVTPTDPVLAGTIVTGTVAQNYIPASVRNVVSVEAGANDGLAYPFVFLPVLVLQHPIDRALIDWVVRSLLWEVGAAIAIGAAVGAAAGAVEQKSSQYEFLEETALLSVTVAFTFAVLGGVKLLGSDGILAAFVAGLLFAQFADPGHEAEEQKVQETVLRLFTVPVFVLFGMVLPWAEWLSLGLPGLVLVAGILLLRRIPLVIVFRRFVPQMDDACDALFAAWFGPIGIAALFYAMVAHRVLAVELVWPVASLVVAASLVVHGVTATPLTKHYARARGTESLE